MLERRGLDRLGDGLVALRARYAAIDHRAALEIGTWLADGCAVSGELLTTQ